MNNKILRPDGASRIAAERKRQLEAEGWTVGHDATHQPGNLTMAAICYATQAASGADMRDALRHIKPRFWPWSLEWWKPGGDDSHASRIRELEKAGALIAAEIDRLSAVTNPAPTES